jgi:4-carboxymuconolactone decarboxylase
MDWPFGVCVVRFRSHEFLNRRKCARKENAMKNTKPTVYESFPKLGQLRNDVLFGDVWEQPDLSKRDRSLVTVAVLVALYRTEELRGHMQLALENGVSQEEIGGLITHLAFYSGWPTAVNAGRVAQEVFEEFDLQI